MLACSQLTGMMCYVCLNLLGKLARSVLPSLRPSEEEEERLRAKVTMI